jgi:hypothetical protein
MEDRFSLVISDCLMWGNAELCLKHALAIWDSLLTDLGPDMTFPLPCHKICRRNLAAKIPCWMTWGREWCRIIRRDLRTLTPKRFELVYYLLLKVHRTSLLLVPPPKNWMVGYSIVFVECETHLEDANILKRPWAPRFFPWLFHNGPSPHHDAIPHFRYGRNHQETCSPLRRG